MGGDLYAHSEAARNVFDEADELLGTKISSICRFGPEETLKETLYTQPAIFVCSVATLRVLESLGAPKPQAVAGHSIGEYAACVAAGAFDFATGLHLVNRRAQEMHRTSVASEGAMAAVLGLEPDAVVEACQAAELEGAGIVDAANFNGGGQVVISGTPGGVARASEIAKERGAKKIVELKVSGAFHSRLMTPAVRSMAVELEKAAIADITIPVVANLTAEYETTAADIRINLAAQIDHSVRWEQSIQRLSADGFDTFVEVGHGTVLSKMMKRLAPDAFVISAGTMEEAQAFAARGENG
ncbi:MAG: fabD [Capsulimonas sp.]|jgi:[acyl-carrier-protein] S-malonyltransferase|nr:fabD [Capsulimonas sp.]